MSTPSPTVLLRVKLKILGVYLVTDKRQFSFTERSQDRGWVTFSRQSRMRAKMTS
jgi:hypothetical protein